MSIQKGKENPKTKTILCRFYISTRTWVGGFTEKRLSGNPKGVLFLFNYSAISASSAVSSAVAEAAA